MCSRNSPKAGSFSTKAELRGSTDGDGLTNGCSTIGISKTQPTEVLEQHYPVLFESYALCERSC